MRVSHAQCVRVESSAFPNLKHTMNKFSDGELVGNVGYNKLSGDVDDFNQKDLIEGQGLVRLMEEMLMETLCWEHLFRQFQMAEMNNMDTESMEKTAYCNLAMEQQVNLELLKLTHVNS